MSRTAWLAIWLTALAFSLALFRAPAAQARGEGFAGTWRGLDGDGDTPEIQRMELTIERRRGTYHAVQIVSRDQQFAKYAMEMNRYVAGALTEESPRVLTSRLRIVETTEGGPIAVIVNNTFRLQPGGNRLTFDTVIHPERFENERLAATWTFERMEQVKEPAPAAGRRSEFEVLRPTFHDAFRVQATGEVARSARPLESGVRYRVRVEGSLALAPAVVGRWVVADGAYVYHAERNSGYFGRTPARVNVLLLNDRPFDPAQGFVTTHIYTMDLVGNGRPLSAVVADSPLEDNEGSLDIRIYCLRRDVLLAERPSSIDRSLLEIDLMLETGRLNEALPRLRDSARRAGDLQKREELYQLIGVLEFVLSRPLDPEEIAKGVVMQGTDLIGRAVDHDPRWPSAQNNRAIWEAWNGNISQRERNARTCLEEAQKLAPNDTVIAGNLSRIRAEARQGR